MLLDQSPDGGSKYSISSRWGGYFTIWDESNSAYYDAPRLAISPGNGGVGIGTLFPYGALHVAIKSPYGAIGNNNTIALRNSDITAWNATSIINYDASNTWHANAAIDFLNHNHGGVTGAGSIRFYTKRPESALAEAMHIAPSGNVGIGTANPHAKLEVRGDIRSYRNGASGANAQIYFANEANSRAWNWQLTANDDSALMGYDGSEWGEKFRVSLAGNVGIGTTNPTHKLAVNGTIKAKEVIVETTGWSDYVFADDYALAPLAEVEAHIKEHKHLPGIPSAAEVSEQGVSVGDMQAKLLAKIEELTLHMISQQKQSADQERRLTLRIETLEVENRLLRTRFEQLEVR